MSNSLLVESAARTLLMGVLIYLALRVFKVRAVRSQRAAWLLALAAALAMPAVLAFGLGPKVLPPLVSFEHTSPAVAAAPQLTAMPSAPVESTMPAKPAQPAPIVWPLIARDVYIFVAATLFLQLLVGLVIAWHIRATSSKIDWPDPEVAVRSSSRIATPVTIASTVILPADYCDWNEATLNVVLCHESAHVRQRDFWIRLFAQLHCTLFWFNPFAWWLKRELADLGEALSDHAATKVAESRAGYAELLLRFARKARWPYLAATMAGVGMAHSSNLSSRIDRLLSEQGFKRAFAESRRGIVFAVLATASAICAATATLRVQAANTETYPVQPITATAAVSAAVTASAAVSAYAQAADPAENPQAHSTRTETMHISRDAGEEGVMAIHMDGSLTMWDDFNEHFAREFAHAHPGAKDDYIYFREGGKGYLIQDPKLLSQARQMLAPLNDLRGKEQELSRRERAEADSQRGIGKEEREVSIQTPDFQQEIARLNKIADEMRAAQSATQMKPEQIGKLQAELGDIQGKLGALEGRAYAAQAQLGARQAEAGERQAKLGEEQAKLGEEQSKLVEQARQNLRPLIEKAIHEGTVPPLE
ncbi:MAG TPA: M56 family metallopeptidase [Steroidobacteraceae bacterium]|jgi:beta-lactamase regulating signal transducer with metallopeptidase domain